MTIRASDIVRSLEASNAALKVRAEKAEQQTRALTKRVSDLESEILALKPSVALPAKLLPPWNLTATENVVFTLLMTREVVSEEAIRIVLYSHKPDEPGLSNASVLVCNVRRKLGARGYRLVTRRGIGWHLPPETRAAIRASLKHKGEVHAEPADPIAAGRASAPSRIAPDAANAGADAATP